MQVSVALSGSRVPNAELSISGDPRCERIFNFSRNSLRKFTLRIYFRDAFLPGIVQYNINTIVKSIILLIFVRIICYLHGTVVVLCHNLRK